MGSGADHDDRTVRFPATREEEGTPYERLAGGAPGSDEKPTLVAPSPSQRMLLVADPVGEDATAAHLDALEESHPADDEPNTMMSQAPGHDSHPVVPADVPSYGSLPAMLAADSVPAVPSADSTRELPASRPRLPTPRMDLRQYTPASIGPTALTLAPPTPSATSIPRPLPLPFPRFDAPEPAPRARFHPVAWIAVGIVLGAAAMFAIVSLRGSSAPSTSPVNANVSVETDLDKVAPMPSARPAASSHR